MMSRKFFLLPTITLVCLIFLIGLIQTAPLNKRQDYCYADFSDDGDLEIPEGRFTWANFDSVRMTGQFNKGFTSKNVNDYEFVIVNKKGNTVMDFSKEIREQMHINPP